VLKITAKSKDKTIICQSLTVEKQYELSIVVVETKHCVILSTLALSMTLVYKNSVMKINWLQITQYRK